ncbi:hypothetical protein D9M71_762350 [compost metagenome]
MGGGHEGGRLFVAGEDQLDSGVAKRFQEVEVFLARNAEDAVHALVFECGDQQV